MRIALHRSGGFANLIVNVATDTAKLAQDKADHLKQMVTKLLPFTHKELEAAPDVCHYLLTVEEDDGNKFDLEANDLTMTDDMQTLFDFLMDEGNQK